jgi:L-alanine-DL-glutamate epimerase-like enolase superfamily enzyme
MWTLKTEVKKWPMREPFRISRHVQTHVDTLVVRIVDEAGNTGRGEACGVNYHGETPATMTAAIDAVRPRIEGGIDRHALLSILPAGGARHAIDAALWDLEAKRSSTPAWQAAGLSQLQAVETAFTIGIRDLEAYERTASQHRNFAVLKVKVATNDPIAAIDAVRRGAPEARLIVDANQAWTAEMLINLSGQLIDRNVVLLEQPMLAGTEGELKGFRSPVPVAADEAVQDRSDLERASHYYDVVNIKLDKTGGLTEALALADAAEALGLRLMVGCMAGSSLSMAPAHLLAQRCAFVDLDGPLLQAQDCDHAIEYDGGVMHAPRPELWG